MTQETTPIQTKKSIDNILFNVVSIFSVLLPLFIIPFTPFVAMSKVILFVLSIVVLTITLTITYLREGKIVLPKSSVIGGLLLVVIVMILSGVISGSTNDGFIGKLDTDTVLFYIAALILVYIVPSAVNTKVRAFKILGLFVGSVLVASLFQIIRVTFSSNILSLGIFSDTNSNLIGSWNDMGILIGFSTIVALLAFEFIASIRGVKLFSSIVIFFSLLMLVIVNNSGIWLAVGLGALLVFVYSFCTTVGKKRVAAEEKIAYRVPIAPLLIVVLSVVFIILAGKVNVFGTVGSISHLSFFNRYNLNVIEGRPSFSATYNLGVSLLKDKHIFGVGPNRFDYAWNMYKTNEINQYAFWNSDFSYGYGIIPSSFVTLGILGVLAWILFLAATIWTGIKLISKRYADRQQQFLIGAAFIGTLYFLFFIFTYTPGTTVIIGAFLMVGFLLAVKEQIPSQREYKTISFISDPRMAFGFVLGLVVFLIGSVISVYWISTVVITQAYTLNSIKYLSVGNIDAAETAITNSLRVAPTDVAYRILASIGIARAQALLQNNNANTAANLRTIIQNSLSVAGAAVSLDKTNYQNWLVLGQVYQLATASDSNDAYTEARKAYTEAEKLNPSSPYIPLLVAQLEQAHGNLDNARDSAVTSITKKTDYLEAYYFLTQVLLGQNKKDDAVATMIASVQAVPDNAVSWYQLGLLYYSLKNYANAAVAFERAVYYSPSFANARYFGGLAYDKLGKHDEAVKIFQVLKETNPDSKEIDTIISNIKAGKPAVADESSVPTKINNATTTKILKNATSTPKR